MSSTTEPARLDESSGDDVRSGQLLSPRRVPRRLGAPLRPRCPAHHPYCKWHGSQLFRIRLDKRAFSSTLARVWVSVSRAETDIPPRKEHAMNEPPPRKRGRRSRRAAAAADLVPDEPFEDVRARESVRFQTKCFSRDAVPQLARKCLEHVISAVRTCLAALRAPRGSSAAPLPGRAASRVQRSL